MNVEENNPKCPICSSDSIFWDAIKEYKTSDDKDFYLRIFKLYKCNLCGHGFYYPGVESNEDLLKYYDENYAKSYTPDVKDESFILREKQYVLDVRLIEKLLSGIKINVLDYGCSTGQFLNNMPIKWNKFGFEVNDFELNYIKEHYKDIKTFSEHSQLEEDFFDLITLRGVIEHLFDFNELFSLIKFSLKKNGIVYICATPDFNSPCSSLYKSFWNQIAAPLHYHQFTAVSACILFAKFGFGLKGLYYPYINTPYADFQNDAKKFIKNIERFFNQENFKDTYHPYPGTMMSLIFKKIK